MVDLLREFQTLATGVLAILAALIAGGFTYLSARMPVQAEKIARKEEEGARAGYVAAVLSADLHLINISAMQAAGAVRNHYAAKQSIDESFRGRYWIQRPAIVEDWQAMVLLGPEAIKKISGLLVFVEQHNRAIEGMNGYFADNNFRKQFLSRCERIQAMCEQSQQEIHQHIYPAR